MAALPVYDAQYLAALEAQAAAILAVFGARNYVRVEPSVLQPADIFLDRSGEEIRRRTFVLSDPGGRELCLRPDLTIPICHAHVNANGAFPARLCYHGLAFRYQPAEPQRPTQFFQAGIELLGLQDRKAAETEVLTLAVESLRAAGVNNFDMKIGDLGLFSAFVDALDIPAQWRGRLKRHFWRAGYFEALLKRLSRGASTDTQRLMAHLGTLEPVEAHSAFEGLMDMLGDAPQGARTREEIIDRLIEQAADAAALRLDPRIADQIGKFLSVTGSASAAISQIRELTKAANVTLDAPLAAMEQRLATLQKLGVAPERVSFAARFGRNMEYYTGFVFELWAHDAEGPVQIAGGGRYDSLLENLGAAQSMPAIGCAIRTERVLAVARAERGRA